MPSSEKSGKNAPRPKPKAGQAANKSRASVEKSAPEEQPIASSTATRERRLSPQQLARLERTQRRQTNRRVGTVIGVMVLVAIVGVFIWQVNSRGSTTANGPKATVSAVPTAPQTPPQINGTPVTLPDGLQYIDISVPQDATATPATTITPGATTTPAPPATPIPVAKNGDSVEVYYTGWLQATDIEFDSSYDHPPLQPLPVTLGAHNTIPGFEEGIVGMKVGGKRRIIIPPALGYGAQGAGNKIPPNSTLIFDVELVSVKSGS